MSYVVSNNFYRGQGNYYGPAGASSLMPGWGNSRAAAGPAMIAVGDFDPTGLLAGGVIEAAKQGVAALFAQAPKPVSPDMVNKAIQMLVQAGMPPNDATVMAQTLMASANSGGGGDGGSSPPPVGLTDADAAIVTNDLVTKYGIPKALADAWVAEAKKLLQMVNPSTGEQQNSPDDVGKVLMAHVDQYRASRPAPKAPRAFATPGFVTRTGVTPSAQATGWWDGLSKSTQTAIAIGGAGLLVGGAWLLTRRKKS